MTTRVRKAAFITKRERPSKRGGPCGAGLKFAQALSCVRLEACYVTDSDLSVRVTANGVERHEEVAES